MEFTEVNSTFILLITYMIVQVVGNICSWEILQENFQHFRSAYVHRRTLGGIEHRLAFMSVLCTVFWPITLLSAATIEVVLEVGEWRDSRWWFKTIAVCGTYTLLYFYITNL